MEKSRGKHQEKQQEDDLNERISTL